MHLYVESSLIDMDIRSCNLQYIHVCNLVYIKVVHMYAKYNADSGRVTQ